MKKEKIELLGLLFCVSVVLFILYGFTGNWPWEPNLYNSYTLQALSWLEGRLDLGQNYTYLELAVYKGKYFVSFPPFPSYVMLPLAMVFGIETPDGILAFIVALIGAAYAWKLFVEVCKSQKNAFFWSLFLVTGTNVLFVTTNGWVWFLAQNMCFTLSLMALYYGKKGRGGISLFLWACSVGCRPLQVIYLPVLLYIIYEKVKEEYPRENFLQILRRKYKWSFPTLGIAISYMALNYARFGSILEFGHNYLPEFTEAEHGQFHLHYILTNLMHLLRLPKLSDTGKVLFYEFNGTAFWLVSPIFISYGIYYIWNLFRKKTGYKLGRNQILPLFVIVHLVCIMAHKTMGGWHFGNRYTNDALPYVFFGLAGLVPNEDKTLKFQYGLFLLGILINVVGTIQIYG